MLKRREREVGAAAESLAKRSCEAALDEECRLTEDRECESAGPVKVSVSYDMGWQKRGRAHHSLSGVGIAIGTRSGQVVGYGTRNKRCSVCHTAQQKKQRPSQT